MQLIPHYRHFCFLEIETYAEMMVGRLRVRHIFSEIWCKLVTHIKLVDVKTNARIQAKLETICTGIEGINFTAIIKLQFPDNISTKIHT